MSVRTALLMLTVLVVVQAAVALPTGVIIEERRGSCDLSKCSDSCKANAQNEQREYVRAECVFNRCICVIMFPLVGPNTFIDRDGGR